jgi:crotonobetainyl-CoA:carnitine CoA-transferase CaiB-like acyl-CoA transferase
MIAELRAMFLTRPRADWLERFRDADVCLTPVNSVPDALTDPHAVARGAVVRHDGQRAVRPGVRVVPTGLPLEPAAGPGATALPRLDPSGAEVGSHFSEKALDPAPELGAHTDEVFHACGVAAASLAYLRARAVI